MFLRDEIKATHFLLVNMLYCKSSQVLEKQDIKINIETRYYCNSHNVLCILSKMQLYLLCLLDVRPYNENKRKLKHLNIETTYTFCFIKDLLYNQSWIIPIIHLVDLNMCSLILVGPRKTDMTTFLLQTT